MQYRAHNTAPWRVLIQILCITACAGDSKPLSAFLPQSYHSQYDLPLDTLVESRPGNATLWYALHEFHVARLTSMTPHEVRAPRFSRSPYGQDRHQRKGGRNCGKGLRSSSRPLTAFMTGLVDIVVLVIATMQLWEPAI